MKFPDGSKTTPCNTDRSRRSRDRYDSYRGIANDEYLPVKGAAPRIKSDMRAGLLLAKLMCCSNRIVQRLRRGEPELDEHRGGKPIELDSTDLEIFARLISEVQNEFDPLRFDSVITRDNVVDSEICG